MSEQFISKMTTVESTRGHREWWEDPDAFDRASAGVGTTRRRTRGNSFLFPYFYLAYDFDSARKILLHTDDEGTDLEELARDIGFRPVDQTDAGKLAREVDLSPRRDDDLVSHQKKHDPDALAV